MNGKHEYHKKRKNTHENRFKNNTLCAIKIHIG